MSTPTSQKEPGYVSPGDDESSFYEPAQVRRRDLVKLHRDGPPPEVPAVHGADDDPRYPSPTSPRTGFAWALDMVVDVVPAVFLVLSVPFIPAGVLSFVVALVVALLGISFVHRVLVHRLMGATVGKTLLGLRLIDPDTGESLSLRELAGVWATNNATIAFVCMGTVTHVVNAFS